MAEYIEREAAIRALNEMLREKRVTIDYDNTPFHCAFDGADMREEQT